MKHHPILVYYCLRVFHPRKYHEVTYHNISEILHHALPDLQVDLCERSLVEEFLSHGIVPYDPAIHAEHLDLLELKMIELLKRNSHNGAQIDQYLFDFFRTDNMLLFLDNKIEYLIADNRGIILAALCDYWHDLGQSINQMESFFSLKKTIEDAHKESAVILKAFSRKHHLTKRHDLSELIETLHLFSETRSAKT